MTANENSDRSGRQPAPAGNSRRSARRFAVGGVILVVVAGAAFYALRDRAKPAPPSPAPAETAPSLAAVAAEPSPPENTNKYVGSQVCAECHAEIAETYAAHPMSNTLAAVADAMPIEVLSDNAAEFEAQGCRYRVQRVGERMVHTEFMTDAAGRLIYEQPVDVQYAVGSGRTARSYVIDRDGILFESPITWYVESQKWALSPGYDENPRQRFNRRVSDGCVQCHSGRAAPAGDRNSNRFEQPPFHELGIGCERCHGPGQQHVEHMSAGGDSKSEGDLLIVNPAKLDKHLSESVCYQCHMDGERRILRKNRAYHDFRPGMATEDIWTVFASQAASRADESLPFTSHVEQMRASACFRESQGELSCTSCHDPHRTPGPTEKAAFYRDRCNSCHSTRGCSLPLDKREAEPALNSCIHCHMPTSGSSDIPHATQSDHRVLRDPYSSREASPAAERGKVWTIFDDSEQRLPASELERARALALCDQAVEEVNRDLMTQAVVALEAVAARDPDDVDVWRSLGFLYGLGRNPEKSRRAFEAALQADPEDELSLKNLALTDYRTRAIAPARRNYEAYQKLNPSDPTTYGPLAAILASSGDLRAGLEAALRGLELDPTQRELRGIAAKLYDRLGERTKAGQELEIQREIGEQLDPWDQKRRERLQQKAQQNPRPEP